ncbi:MAG: response regulator [Gemmatimonadaceae bacterium]|nr:response regulator [Gemmatimonadaceae bacterium]
MTAQPLSRRFILVIEDEPGIRSIIDRLLKQFGYPTLLAASGSEALRLFDMHAPDIALVLLDWTMPGIGGKQTLAELLARRPELRVILVTGSREATTDDEATQGTISILLKPFTPTELMLAVRTVLEA